MRTTGLQLLAVSLLVAPALADILIGAPYSVPSRVASDGSIVSDFGTFSIVLSGGEGAFEQSCSYGPAPMVTTTSRSGAVLMAATAYRAPVWPSGFDVIEVALTNTSREAATAELKLVGPDGTSWGDREAMVGSRSIARLPEGLEPVRERRAWGCATGSPSMPGWARPNRECDPAFRNIRAGMGGVPIIYEFDVAPGSEHQVLLGLCESHWRTAGQRPVALFVEGAEREVVDPVAEWGADGVGVLYFSARDRNGDGILRIVAAPVEGSPDLNPILNVIWIFSPNEYVDSDEVVKGALNSAAEYRVDVGGTEDQNLYESGDLQCPVPLDAGETRTMAFLVAAPGASLPAWRGTPPSPTELRRSAETVWAGWLGNPTPSRVPSSEAMPALAQLAMSIRQYDLTHVALPEPNATELDYALGRQALAAMALDAYGAHDSARALLRLLWAPDPPTELASFAQREDGTWPDPAGQDSAQALGLLALVRHAELTGDRAWAQRAWPAISRGAVAVAGDAETPRSWQAEAIGAYLELARTMGLEPAPVAAAAGGHTGGPPAWEQAGGGCATSSCARSLLALAGT